MVENCASVGGRTVPVALVITVLFVMFFLIMIVLVAFAISDSSMFPTAATCG